VQDEFSEHEDDDIDRTSDVSDGASDLSDYLGDREIERRESERLDEGQVGY
jgi:hypothetical protein